MADVITVPGGTMERITLGDGDVLENTIIDITAPGAALHVKANGDGWAIRNVAVRGEQPDAHALDVNNMFNVSVPNADGSAEIDTLYLADGVEAAPADGGAMFLDAWGDDWHRGTLTMRNVHIAGFPDNGFYGSDTGKQHGSDTAGEVHIRDSYFHNNNISQVRIGSSDSTVRNTVAVVDGAVPPHPNGTRPRGFWTRETARVVFEDCATWQSGPDAAEAVWADESSTAVLRNVGVEGDTREGAANGTGSGRIVDEGIHGLSSVPPPPAGAPMTPEEAVDVPEPEGTRLDIVGQSTSDECEWVVEVEDGEITAVSSFEGPDNQPSDTKAEGVVWDATDTLWYTGCIRRFGWSGPSPVVRRDGRTVSLPDVADCPPLDPCEGVTCPDGQHCEDGECVPDEPDPDPPEDDGTQQAAVVVLGLGVAAAAARRYYRGE